MAEKLKIKTELPLFCPHCAASNPRTAYVCLTCHKVMYPKVKGNVLNRNVRPGTSVLVIVLALLLASIGVVYNWIKMTKAGISSDQVAMALVEQ